MIKKYIPQDYNQPFPDNKPMDIDVNMVEYVKDGTICVNASDTSGFVYDTNGILCESSKLYRYNSCNKPCNFKTAKDVVDEEVVFMGGGYLFWHFGHFLLEGLARVYPVLDKKFQNKKYVFVVKKGTKSLPSYVLTILNSLGIKSDNIILIHKTTKFTGVYVPPQASVITHGFAPIMTRVFNKITQNLNDKNIQTYDKLYLSRSKMNDGRTFGEHKIERIFANNGYKIIWPETLSLSEQITLVNNCKIMAGTAGTALHLAMFMRPKGTVIQIKRNTLPIDNADVQKQICDVCGLNFIYVLGSIEKIPTKHFTSVPQIIGVTPYMQQFFNDNNFKFSDTDIELDQDAWNAYLRQLKKYNRKHKYNKIIGLFARVIAIFGVTKYGRQIIREYIKRIFRAY